MPVQHGMQSLFGGKAAHQLAWQQADAAKEAEREEKAAAKQAEKEDKEAAKRAMKAKAAAGKEASKAAAELAKLEGLLKEAKARTTTALEEELAANQHAEECAAQAEDEQRAHEDALKIAVVDGTAAVESEVSEANEADMAATKEALREADEAAKAAASEAKKFTQARVKAESAEAKLLKKIDKMRPAIELAEEPGEEGGELAEELGDEPTSAAIKSTALLPATITPGVVQTGLGLLELECRCWKCGDEVNALRCIKKSQNTYWCNRCASRHSKLQRIFGTWPPSEFNDLPAPEQQEFWKAAFAADGDDELEQLVCSTLAKKIVDVESRKVEGSFQPLSFYERLGYDTELIKKNTPEHMREMNPQLGECFKVKVTTDSQGRVVEKVREQLLKRKAEHTASQPKGGKRPRISWLQRKKSKEASGAEAVDEAKKAKKKGKKEKKKKKKSSSSSSSSNSSSTEEADEKKKAQKAAKKQEQKVAKKKKKAELKEKAAQRAAEMEQNRRSKKAQNEANKVVSRCSPIQVSLERDLEDELIKKVPAAVRGEAQKAMKEINKYVEEAKKKLAATTPTPYTETVIEGFDKDRKAWVDAAQLLASQLAAIRKCA